MFVYRVLSLLAKSLAILATTSLGAQGSEPLKIEVSGIDNTAAIAGNLTGHLKVESESVIKQVAFFIDDQYIFSRRLDTHDCGFSFRANIKKFGDGAHTLRVEAVYGDNEPFHQVTREYPFLVSDNAWITGFDSQKYSTEQGKTLHISVESNQKLVDSYIEFMGAKHPLYKNRKRNCYESFVPVAFDAPIGKRKIIALLKEKNGSAQKLESNVVVKNTVFKLASGRNFKTKNHHKPKSYYNKGSGRGLISTNFITKSPPYRLWDSPFESPIKIRAVSAPFGEQRTSKKLGRYVHKGADLVDYAGAPIKSPANGVVVFKSKNKWTGNTVILDHGCGIFTLYAHMKKFGAVQTGKPIKKGTVLGYIGKTGYAFGEHLHWELRINGIPVDPMQWLDQTF